MLDIITIGEMLIDLTQTGISETGIPVYTAFPGGAPANVAVAAAKLGAKTGFIGKVGNDAFGNLLVETLKQNDVNTDNMIISDKANTTLAVVSLKDGGERDFAFYRKGFADTRLSESEISNSVLQSAHIVHFGSVSMTEEPSRTATISAVHRAKEMGAAISYDPNYRANLWGGREEAIKMMKKPLDMVDILKVSDDELPLLSGNSDIEKGAEVLAKEFNIPLVLVTLGSKGAYYLLGDHKGFSEGIKVTVADTNGAGDTFLGAFLSGMVKLGKYDPSSLTDDEVKKLVAFSNKAASITASRSGAIPAMPSYDEVIR